MKKYIVSNHATERAVERLGFKREHADNRLNQIMQTAFYIGDSENERGQTARIFDHTKTRTRIKVDKDSDVIITVYKFPNEVSELATTQSIPEAFADDIRQLVRRKFKAKERDFKRKHRDLEIEFAEINLELAQLTLNQLKAKSPKTRNSIADKIGEVKTKAERIQYEIKSAVNAFESMTKEVDAVCKS